MQEINSILKLRPSCTPDSSFSRKPTRTQQLGAMVYSKRCWPGCPEELVLRAHHKTYQKGNVVTASVVAMMSLCYVDNQLKYQEHISFLHNPLHRLFTVVFFSLFSVDVLVVFTTALLCLSFHGTLPFAHSDFFLLFALFFLSASSVSLLFLSWFSSFLYWLCCLTAGGWAKVSPLPSKHLGSRSYSHLLPCFFYDLFSHAVFSVVFPH